MSGLGTRVATAALRLLRLNGRRHVRERHALVLASNQWRGSGKSDAGAAPLRASASISHTVPPRQMEAPEVQRTAQQTQGGMQRQGDQSACHLPAWRNQCDAMAKAAIRDSGLSHDWCIELYSAQVDQALSQLPENVRSSAMEVAAELFDYRTVELREQTARWNTENGYCRHGITLDCCPAGCGSAPSEMETGPDDSDNTTEADQT